MRKETGSASHGALFALAAYGIWGIAPLYWKALAVVPASELLAWRVLTSCVVGLVLVGATGAWPALRADLGSPRRCALLALTATLIGANWLVFIWAVLHGQVLATSLGYYITPLVNVALGMTFLRERLRFGQAVAVLLAVVGVGQLALSFTTVTWVSLFLAFTFAFYGMIRKVAPVEPVVGFSIETLLLAPAAATYLVLLSGPGRVASYAEDAWIPVLLGAAGIFTAAPLICFNAAARRLRLVTLGFFQYIAPSLSLVLAITWFGEPFRIREGIAFGCVWIALAIYSVDSLRARAASPPPPSISTPRSPSIRP
ncbi:MAG: EamA family transporter RarD [Myxococcota bacterium]|nr:EamA family transporter RarD [Myxococcota bacterium]